MGRPRKTWNEDDVEQFKALCGIFCTRKECATILGVDMRTLDRLIAEHFPDTPTWAEAFDYYSGEGRATLRRKMFELAMAGDKTALIFMAKNYLGMSDEGRVADKSDAKPVKVTTMVGNSKWAKGRAVNG